MRECHQVGVMGWKCNIILTPGNMYLPTCVLCLSIADPDVKEPIFVVNNNHHDRSDRGSSFLAMAKQYKNENFLCDICLKFTDISGEEDTIHAHKLILSCCSDFFREIFKQEGVSEVNLSGTRYNARCLNAVIDFLYGGNFEGLTSAEASECLSMSCTLQIESAVKLLLAHLRSRRLHSGNNQQYPVTVNWEDPDACLNYSEVSGFPENEDCEELNPQSVQTNKPVLSVCEICEETFEKGLLKKHFDDVHGDHPKKPRKKNTHKCKECNKSFRRPCKLQEHMHMHEGLRPHLCPHCGKSFFGRDHLNQHLKTHQEEREIFHCDQCSQVFVKKGSLTDHIKFKHSSAKQHACHICGKSFRWPQVLKRHQLTHQPKESKKFKCSEAACPWAFHTKALLQRHMRKHRKVCSLMTDSSFKCTKCDLVFVKKADLKNHLKVSCASSHKPTKNTEQPLCLDVPNMTSNEQTSKHLPLIVNDHAISESQTTVIQNLGQDLGESFQWSYQC